MKIAGYVNWIMLYLEYVELTRGLIPAKFGVRQ